MSQIRLNPHAKSLFLRHSSKSPVHPKKILKLLKISKGFLFTSRQYKLYTIEYVKRDEDNTHIIWLKPVDETPKYNSTHISVSLNELINLNKLLKFSIITVGIERRMKQESIDWYKELFEKHFPEVKLNLIIEGTRYHKLFVFQFISKFSDRISTLECESSVLKNLGPLNFDCYTLRKIHKFNQLYWILKKHAVKKLDLHFSIDFNASKIQGNYFDDFPISPELNTLIIKSYPINQDQENDLQILIEFLELFPNLKTLSIEICDKNLMNNMTDPILFVNNVLKTIEKIERFKNACQSSINVTILTSFVNTIRDQKESNIILIEKAIDGLKENKYFEGAKVRTWKWYNSYTMYNVTNTLKMGNFNTSFCVNFQLMCNNVLFDKNYLIKII